MGSCCTCLVSHLLLIIKHRSFGEGMVYSFRIHNNTPFCSQVDQVILLYTISLTRMSAITAASLITVVRSSQGTWSLKATALVSALQLLLLLWCTVRTACTCNVLPSVQSLCAFFFISVRNKQQIQLVQ